MYDFVNLIEFGICARLLEMGHGVQSVKCVLEDLRFWGLVEGWAEDEREFFRKWYTMAGGVFGDVIGAESVKSTNRVKRLEESFREMFYYEPLRTKEVSSGILFYFIGGALKRRAVIVPKTRFLQSQKLLPALKRVYGILLRQGAVIILDVGEIRKQIEESLKQHSLL